MKRICLAFFLFIPFSRPLFAAITDEGVTREKEVVVHFSTTVAAATSPNFVLVALSTTPGLFPHTDTGEIDISHIDLILDKVAAATATVRIGVVTFVNNSTGSATYFFNFQSNKNVSNTLGGVFPNFTPSFYRCKVVKSSTSADTDGATPYILSNDKLTGSTVFEATTTTSIQLNSPIGLITPKPGDIVAQIITDATNAVNVVLDIWYHSEIK